MPGFYFDIETTGLDPKKDKIITIQYQELDRNTGEAKGELVVLKEWESSEREILHSFLSESGIMEEYAFSFIPIGYNLRFEHNFIKERTVINGLPTVDILDIPFIDLRAIGILMNKGEFKGSGLDKLTGKSGSGGQVPVWYLNKEFQKIVDYIECEAKEFVKFNAWLYRRLPGVLEEWRSGVES